MTTVSLGIRIPDFLRDQLSKLAQGNHRSLNNEIVERLLTSLRPSRPIAKEIFEALDAGKVFRMRTGNTGADCDRIKLLVENLHPDQIILGAKRDSLNDAVLVFVAYVSGLTFIMDSTYLNMARSGREHEIQQVFKCIDKEGLLGVTSHFTEYLPDTSKLTAEEALSTITKTNSKNLDDVSQYLRLLSVHGVFEVEDFRNERL